MRWPIRLQLLLPILFVVVLAVVTVSAASAWFLVDQAREQQEESIRRLRGTVAGATFPLTENVLRQMSGLSGAEFVLLDPQGRVQSGTLSLTDKDRAALGRLPPGESRAGFADSPVVKLSTGAYLAERLPVTRRRDGTEPGSLIVIYPEGRWRAAVLQAVYPVLAIGVAALALLVMVITALAQRFIARIRRLGRQTAAVAAGDFSPLPVGPRDDEIRDLAVAINQMSEKLSQYEAEVRRSERLRTLGQLGAGMAHQLRNSATGAVMAIELHQRECSTGTSCESLQVALRQLTLMESYLQRFLTLGSSEPRAHEKVSLDALVRDVLALVEPACVHAKIDLAFADPADPITVCGDPLALRQLLVNLVANAMEAAGRHAKPTGRVVIELERLGPDRALLRVKDSGPGPSAAIQDRLFDPFVTEKPDGTGLGLSVARQIAEAHQAAIRWQREDEMTCFLVDFPLLDS